MIDFDPEQEVLMATQWRDDVLALAGRENVRVTQLRALIRFEVERRKRLCVEWMPYPFEAIRCVDASVRTGLVEYGFGASMTDELEDVMEDCVDLQKHYKEKEDIRYRKRLDEIYWKTSAGRVRMFLSFILAWGVLALWFCIYYLSVRAFLWAAGLVLVMSFLCEMGVYHEVVL